MGSVFVDCRTAFDPIGGGTPPMDVTSAEESHSADRSSTASPTMYRGAKRALTVVDLDGLLGVGGLSVWFLFVLVQVLLLLAMVV